METKNCCIVTVVGKEYCPGWSRMCLQLSRGGDIFLKRMEKHIASASVSHAMTGYGQDFRYRWR